MKKTTILLGSLALSACTTMQNPAKTAASAPAATAPQAPEFSVPQMKEMVRQLSSDEFEGRGPSTPVEPKVLDYIVSQFKAAGLQPGNKGEWLQAVPMVAIQAVQPSPLTITGPGTRSGKPLSFTFGNQFVAGSYRVVPQTRIADSEMVFVGYGINAPELGWNDYAGLDMKGKTAVILVNDPDYAAETEEGLFKGRRMTYYGRWTYKFEEAARQGATAALIVHDTFPAAYGWNVVQSGWEGEQNMVQSANDGMDQTAANGWVQKDVAEAMFTASGKDFAALSAAAKQKGFKAVPLGLKASLSFDNTIRKANSYNVVGMLPGTTRPDEYVLYSAHWDHLGRCTPDATGDDICNGAVDNATGVAAITAIAQANAKMGPTARSQVFIALTLEESGTLGSEYYAANPVFPLERTVGGVNLDSLAPSGLTRNFAMTGGDKSELNDLFRAALARHGLVEAAEQHSERGYYYRSDHFSFAKLGVPMFTVGRGADLVNGGDAAGQAISDAYSTNHYHAPSDEYSEDWDWTGIVQEMTLDFELGRELAQGATWPNWRPTDEFRTIRDKSCAARGVC